jgi:hypothetical protein
MKTRGEAAKGHIINSEGQTDNDTWGKRAAWCDYYGPVSGETVGVAIGDYLSLAQISDNAFTANARSAAQVNMDKAQGHTSYRIAQRANANCTLKT